MPCVKSSQKLGTTAASANPSFSNKTSLNLAQVFPSSFLDHFYTLIKLVSLKVTKPCSVSACDLLQGGAVAYAAAVLSAFGLRACIVTGKLPKG